MLSGKIILGETYEKNNLAVANNCLSNVRGYIDILDFHVFYV